jgi:hypothetical protein
VPWKLGTVTDRFVDAQDQVPGAAVLDQVAALDAVGGVAGCGAIGDLAIADGAPVGELFAQVGPVVGRQVAFGGRG